MKRLIFAALAVLALCSCAEDITPKHYEIKLGKIPETAVFTDSADGKWTVWGASAVKGDDGLYHMYYSRWPKGLGWSWAVDSQVAHAVSESVEGPWEFRDVALPRRGKEYWDGWCTHNPTIRRFDGKYYLYYMGNTGDGEIVGTPEKAVLNWQHRNNQRIGVAVADNPNGPWTRSDKPLIDISADSVAYDCLLTSNPAMCKMHDGRYLFVYKAVSKRLPMPAGGPVVAMAATADSPTGPVVKEKKLVFYYEGERFGVEDPYIWYHNGVYRAIVKRISDWATHKMSLMQYESLDGVNWQEAKYSHVSDIEINMADGRNIKVAHLDRPQMFFNEEGEPIALFCAADTIDSNKVVHSFNVQIPLTFEEHELDATDFEE